MIPTCRLWKPPPFERGICFSGAVVNDQATGISWGSVEASITITKYCQERGRAPPQTLWRPASPSRGSRRRGGIS
jgi:hypothetical protein